MKMVILNKVSYFIFLILKIFKYNKTFILQQKEYEDEDIVKTINPINWKLDK